MNKTWFAIISCLVLSIVAGLLLSLVIPSAPIVGISAGLIGYGATCLIGDRLFIRKGRNESR